MAESSEVATPKETKTYSPQETHRSWVKMAKAAVEIVRPMSLYSGSAAMAFNSGIMAEKAGSLSYVETIKSVAEQIGTSVSPESIQQVMDLLKTNEGSSLLWLVAAGGFFTAGSASVAATTLKAYRK